MSMCRFLDLGLKLLVLIISSCLLARFPYSEHPDFYLFVLGASGFVIAFRFFFFV
jgi:hypothetical protein